MIEFNQWINPNLNVVLKNFIKIKREYWIVVHENNYQLERIKVFCNFLREIVKKRIYNFN